MSFDPEPGSRKAESNYLDISTESFPFKLSYPGTSKSKVPNRFSDPNYPDGRARYAAMGREKPTPCTMSRWRERECVYARAHQPSPVAASPGSP